jgi:hypothetical protein
MVFNTNLFYSYTSSTFGTMPFFSFIMSSQGARASASGKAVNDGKNRDALQRLRLSRSPWTSGDCRWHAPGRAAAASGPPPLSSRLSPGPLGCSRPDSLTCMARLREATEDTCRCAVYPSVACQCALTQVVAPPCYVRSSWRSAKAIGRPKPRHCSWAHVCLRLRMAAQQTGCDVNVLPTSDKGCKVCFSRQLLQEIKCRHRHRRSSSTSTPSTPSTSSSPPTITIKLIGDQYCRNAHITDNIPPQRRHLQHLQRPQHPRAPRSNPVSTTEPQPALDAQPGPAGARRVSREEPTAVACAA